MPPQGGKPFLPPSVIRTLRLQAGSEILEGGEENAGALGLSKARTPFTMAIQVLPILRALAPLIAEAGGLVAGFRSSGKNTKVEDRVSQLEQQTIRAGEVLTGLARQLEAVANQLRVQAEATQALQRQAKISLIMSIVALGAGVGALVAALVM